MAIEQPKESLPFKPDLEFSDLENLNSFNAGNIHSLGDKYIVRRFTIKLNEQEKKSSPEQRKVMITALQQERITDEKIADSLFEQLHKQYGVAIAPYHRVIGADTAGGDRAIYTVVNRVEGQPLDELNADEVKKYREQIDRMFTGLFRQLNDVLTAGGVFHSELLAMQFMAGTMSGHPEMRPDVYLVDLDPFCFEYNPESENQETLLSLGVAILRLVGDLELIDSKLEVKMTNAEQAASTAVRNLLRIQDKDEFFRSYIDELAEVSRIIKKVELELSNPTESFD